MKKAFFICPHPDDEILIGGGFLYALAHSREWETFIIYATNGDFHNEGKKRINEAISSCKVLGVGENHVFFLGYGDQWRGLHIYNCDDQKMCKSHVGRTETYCEEAHSEYCACRNGKHNDYCKYNYKKDLREILEDFLPDVIVSVDFDDNPDHRAIKLLFEEVIREILVKNLDYKPLLLSKLAYEGVLKGKNDYHKIPHRPSICLVNDMLSTPILKWNNRIAFAVPHECNTVKIFNNVLLKAARKHNTQNIVCRIGRISNSDIVYWRIPSENLALIASIKTSSGNEMFLNDFKTIDSKNVGEKNCRLDASVWIPDDDDRKKEAILSWMYKIRIKRIEIYENPSYGDDINRLIVKLPEHKEILVTDIRHDGSATTITFNEEIVTEYISIELIDCSGKAGISEIAVYSDVSSIESYNLPIQVFCEAQDITNKQQKHFSLELVCDYCLYRLYVIWRRIYMQMYKMYRLISLLDYRGRK